VCVRDAVASSGQRTRLACWRARPAIANFPSRSSMRSVARLKTRLFRRDAETSTRDACAPRIMRMRAKLFAEPLTELCARIFAVELRDKTGADLGGTHCFALISVGAITKSLFIHC
jgi:hypothetical protein